MLYFYDMSVINLSLLRYRGRWREFRERERGESATLVPKIFQRQLFQRPVDASATLLYCPVVASLYRHRIAAWMNQEKSANF